jgi:thioredoxin reductase/ferredoxin
MVGISEFRLPRSIVRKEIDSLRSLGVLFKTSVSVGVDVTLDDLRREGFEAFFLGIGAHRGQKLGIEGEDEYPGVYDALSFMRQVGLGSREKPAKKVIVVGEGNGALDAARTCVRLGCEEVHLIYSGSRTEMPANSYEVQQAIDEGVQFHFLSVPIRIGGTGKIEYVECLHTEMRQSDANGRRRFTPIPDSNFRIEVGAVIAAIGQEPDFDAFEQLPAEVNHRNLIITDGLTSRTSTRDVFAGGDVVTGPATVVQAIAAGKQAALDIENYLAGTGKLQIFSVRKKPRVDFAIVSAAEKITTPRMTPPLLDPLVRSRTFEPIELSLSEEEAKREAARCLRCDVCIRCGVCEKVCREEVKVHALDFKPISPSERILHDYKRPAERCITCGACALACPTQAIQMVDTPSGKREMHLCGTVLNSVQLVPCESCGELIAPHRFMEYVAARNDDQLHQHSWKLLCARCTRSSRAVTLAGPYFVTSSKK